VTIDQARLLTQIAERDPLHVAPWPDGVIEKVGYPVDSTYAEHFWLPVIGPSALWALSRLVAGLSQTPDGYDVPLAPLAAALGLGTSVSRTAPVVRTISRLIVFELATMGPESLHVRRAVPPLAQRQQRRLPSHLQALLALDGAGGDAAGVRGSGKSPGASVAMEPVDA
jgi:hypothetical protein